MKYSALIAWSISMSAMAAPLLQSGAMIGDVNDDGRIDVVDLRLLQRHILKAAPLTGGARARSDVRSDGEVDIGDYLQLQAIILSSPKPSGLTAAQMGLLINDNDPYSVAIGEYYRTRRGIPAANIVHVHAPVDVPSIDRTTFAALKATVDATLPPTVQALAIAWTTPSRVECNSLTSAFARGFWAAPCDTPRQPGLPAPTCSAGQPSRYYDSNTAQPFTDYQMRPAMMLAAWSVAEGRALIDRGVAADATYPAGAAYVMATSDTTRSLRAVGFPAGTSLSPYVDAQVVHADSIAETDDALFYFQGLTAVPDIASNRFPPGAVADHLTSLGGMLTDSSQMSALQFIAGGVTGTFGTVSEPCAQAAKFPDPAIVIRRYTRGETLIEAYWKSVSVTFQGEFVGEPLANPWRTRGAIAVP